MKRNPSLTRRIGRVVKHYRKAEQMSQATLGRRARLSAKYVGEVERGQKSMTLEAFAAVAAALGTAMHVLLAGMSANGGRRNA